MSRSILVVIPTYNEASTIEAVIYKLSENLPTMYEIIFVVVDGGSTDGCQNIVKKISEDRPDVHLLANPKKIQSAAINLAAKQFGKNVDVLIRCDAHAKYPTDFIKKLINSLDKSSADAIVVPMDSKGENCVQNAVAWISDTIVGSGGAAHRGGRASGFVDHGHHAAFLMATFNRVGGYDETFSHNEDAEYDCRQRALGAKIYLDADIRLGYFPRKKLEHLWQQYFNYGQGRSRTVRRHPASLRIRQLAVPAHLLYSIMSLVLGYWFPVLLLWPIFYVTVLAATSVRIAVQHASVCGLIAGLCAFVMHSAWSFGFYWGLLFIREPKWSSYNAKPLWSNHISTKIDNE